MSVERGGDRGMFRKIAEWAAGLSIMAILVIILNVCQPTLSPADLAYSKGRLWADQNPTLNVNDCPRDRGNPFWFGCIEEYDRVAEGAAR